MRVLVFGAGVIGCLYGALLGQAGHDVSVYARGQRLEMLREHGLRYRVGNEIRQANVQVIAQLDPLDAFDFVLLTVREDQLHEALAELRGNSTPFVVTMVNSLETYDQWEEICGRGRIVPAFPGAGGGWDGTVLNAALTPRAIQPTTIGRSGGHERVLASLFRSAGIPCQVVSDMHAWQICHLAMVVPIADAYYEASDPAHAGSDAKLMVRTALRIRENLQAVAQRGIRLSPTKMNLFRALPVPFIAAGLGIAFRSPFGDRFMYQHSLKAPQEMRRLHDQLYSFLDLQIR